MPDASEKLSFEVSASLQRLIGRELVPTDEFATTELVKNAYDSGARVVTITVQPVTEKEPGYIRVEDDGSGMTLSDFRRLFMFAGYSERPDEVDEAKRIPTGEKGIGRFAADRLGRLLTIATKDGDSPKVLRVEFDWEDFRGKRKKFNEVRVPYELITDQQWPRNRRGTTYEITKLRAIWTREKILSLRSSLGELLNPFNTPRDFKIEVVVPHAATLTGHIKQDIPVGADHDIEFRVTKAGQFERRVNVHGAKKSDWSVVEGPEELKYLIGMKGRLLYFNRRPTKSQIGSIRWGVKVFRDGFRLEPFGSPTADWLGLTEKRAKRAGHAHLVPNRLFGFVEISRKSNPDLKDTTSRQALLETEAVQALVSFLRGEADFLENRIRTEVSEPRWGVGRQKKAVELERARLHSLGIVSFGLAHEIRQPLQSIRSEAGNIGTRLRQLGISDQDISEAQRSIDEDIERIDETIELVSDIATGNLDDVNEFDLAEFVRKESKLFASRSKAIGVDLDVQAGPTQPAAINRTTFSTALLNLWKNSIDAIQEARDGRQGKIRIDLSRGSNGHILEVTDNGVGIPPDIRQKIFKRFATKKTGGLGIGLYYCSTIIEAHGGEITFTSNEGKGTTFRVRIPDKLTGVPNAASNSNR
jgi:signal transduction histidine kinase